jgi:parallel beta-helix repeat protein
MMSVSALMLALMFAGMSGVNADTYVENNIASNIVWDEGGSPYIVNNTIYVLEDQTLTIGPGVTVHFAPGAGIIVNGTLVVEGNATHKVIFDSIPVVDDVEGAWTGLYFNPGSIATIDHALINNTMETLRAIDSKLTVTNTAITNTIKAVYAEFDVGGSLVIDGCFIDAQSGPGPSIAILVDASADGVHENVTAVDVTITNNLVNSTNPEGLLYISRCVEAEDNSIATIVGNILVSGNEFNLLASGGNLAHFYDYVEAVDNAKATIRGNITYSDNQAYTTSPNNNGMTYFQRTVTGNDNSTASLIGDILTSDNAFNQTYMGSDFIYVDVYLDAYNNATAIIEGDFTAVRNEMLQAGDDACYLSIYVWAGNDNSTARMSGDIIIDDNYVEKAFWGPYICLSLGSEGFGKVCVVGDVTMNGNEIGNAINYGVYYWCDINAEDNSAVSFVGDVTMNGNEIDFAQEAFIAYWDVNAAQDNATVDVSACLNIEDNWVGGTDYAFQVGGVLCDDFFNKPVSQDARVHLQADMTILNNVVELANNNAFKADFKTGLVVVDRASVCIDGSLLVEGNQFSCAMGNATSVERKAWAQDQAEMAVNVEISFVNNEILLNRTSSMGFTAMYFEDHVEACDEAAAAVSGNLIISDNDVVDNGPSIGLEWSAYLIHLDKTVKGEDNATSTLRGYILISDNVFDQVSMNSEFIYMGIDMDAHNNATAELVGDVTIVDNDMVNIGRDAAYLSTDLSADGENATVRLIGDVAICDNRIENVSSGPDVYLNLEASGGSTIIVDGDVCLNNNIIGNCVYYATYYGLWIDAQDDSAVTVNGDVSMSGNIVGECLSDSDFAAFTYYSKIKVDENGTANVASDLAVEDNEVTSTGYGVRITVVSNERGDYVRNTTISFVGDFVVRDNSFTYCENSAIWTRLALRSWQYGDLTYDSSLVIEDNLVEECEVFAVITQNHVARGHSEVDISFPICIFDNEVVDANAFLRYDAEYIGRGEASLSYKGDICVEDNECSYLDRRFINYDVSMSAYVRSNVLIESGLFVDANIVAAGQVGIQYDMDLNARGSSTIQACAPMTVTGNSFTVGSSMVEAEVYLEVHRNATAELCNDVVVENNVMEQIGPGILDAPANPSFSGYGLHLSQDVWAYSYFGSASGTITSEVQFCGNTLVGDDLVGMNVYRDAYAYGDYANASACIVGDVTATNNDITINGAGVGLTGGAEVSAEAEMGNASAVVDTLFCISQNEIRTNGGYGIVATGIGYGSDYDDGNGNVSMTDLDIAFVIRDNCIHVLESAMGPRGVITDDVGIYVAILGVEPQNVDVAITGNTIDMVSGTGIMVDDSYRGVEYPIDDVTVVIKNNDITVGTGTGILIKGGEVRLIDNTIEGGNYGVRFDSCQGIEFRGNTFKGNYYGIYVYETEGIVIDGNAFLENDCGVYLEGDLNTTVRDNFFSKNVVGLNASGSSGLVVEDCYFQRNGDGAKLDAVDGVVGNNTFYMNERNGLIVVGGVLAIYNGEYDQNDLGLSVVGGSVDWFVDARAVVHANGVYFGGEIVITGTLVLDYADLELRPDADVVHGIYAGYARLTVAVGGCLEAYNSVIGGEHSTLWFFDVYGKMSMTNCYMTDMYEVYLGKSSKVEMTTTTIDDAHGNGIRIVGCSPIIRGCTITGSSMDGIYIADGAKPTIVGCTITGSDRGIYAFESCLDLVVDNVIVMNEYGVYAERVTGTVHDNVMMLNGVELFMLECDVVVANNQFGYGRLVEMNEALASALLQAIDELVDVNIDMRGGLGAVGPEPGFGLDAIIAELSLSSLNGRVGMYAIDSSIEASGNEYGWLQTAVYLMRSDIVFSDVIRTNTFDMTYANGTRTLSIPFTVYDGIYAVDSTLTIRNASIQAVDDAIFLENSRALILDSSFDAGDYDLYLFRNAEAAVCGSLDKYAVLDSSRLYWLAELTVSVVDQDGWGIGGAAVVVKDSNGRVWSEGMTAKSGVLVAHAPYALETRNGVNDSLGRCVIAASFGDQASTEAEVDVDGDEAVTLKMTMKKNSLFGMSPLVLGIVALVIVAVIVGAVMLARRK